jgi:hypothetical protein
MTTFGIYGSTPSSSVIMELEGQTIAIKKKLKVGQTVNNFTATQRSKKYDSVT